MPTFLQRLVVGRLDTFAWMLFAIAIAIAILFMRAEEMEVDEREVDAVDRACFESLLQLGIGKERAVVMAGHVRCPVCTCASEHSDLWPHSKWRTTLCLPTPRPMQNRSAQGCAETADAEADENRSAQ